MRRSTFLHSKNNARADWPLSSIESLMDSSCSARLAHSQNQISHQQHSNSNYKSKHINKQANLIEDQSLQANHFKHEAEIGE